jgi:hypothetical protein
MNALELEGLKYHHITIISRLQWPPLKMIESLIASGSTKDEEIARCLPKRIG